MVIEGEIRSPTYPRSVPRYVVRARALAQGRYAQRPCGRQLKTANRRCSRPKAPLSPACPIHLTIEERAEACERRIRAESISRRWAAALEPACFAWEVADTDLAAARAVMASREDEADQQAEGLDLLWRWQQGRCAICGFGWGATTYIDPAAGINETRWSTEEFVMDHDHATAFIRGWLCQSCNISEGVGDDGALAKYRTQPPAAMLGVAVRYWSPFHGWATPERVRHSSDDPEASPAWKVAASLAKAKRKLTRGTGP